MENLKHLHWPLILGLGALALIRPVMSATGVMDTLGRPAGPLLVTLAISVAWALVIGLSRVAQPGALALGLRRVLGARREAA